MTRIGGRTTTTTRPFRFASIVLAALFATAACTSSRDEKTTTGPSSGKRTASAPGVTADTIRIGFTYPDLEQLAKAGVIKTDWGPVEEVVKALVDDVNVKGGVNGRKLQVTLAKYFPPSNTEQLTACNKLTEDDQVFAVLGGFIGDLNTCITQQHSTILISGYGTGFNENVLSKARAPWATWLASDERSTKALVKLLDDNGKLEGHTIGIYAQQITAESLADLTREALGDAGYEAVDTAINDVQSTDLQAFNAQEKLLGERFRDKNVDTVIVVGGAPPGSNWDAVGFHPSLYLPSTGYIGAAAATNPLDKFPFVGGLSVNGDPENNYDTPAMKRCRDVWKRASGSDVKPPTQEAADRKSSGFVALGSACTALKVFVEAAKAAGTTLTPDSWKTGLGSLGTIDLALAPVASFGPDKPDGQDTFLLQQHDPKWKLGSGIPEFISIGKTITLRS